MDALAPLPNDGDSDDPDADAGKQRSLTEHVNPVDWLEANNWGTLTIVASYTPADITFPGDLKLRPRPLAWCKSRGPNALIRG